MTVNTTNGKDRNWDNWQIIVYGVVFPIKIYYGYIYRNKIKFSMYIVFQKEKIGKTLFNIFEKGL